MKFRRHESAVKLLSDMLVAHCNGMKVEASTSERGAIYTCPKCARELTLKKGAIVVAHFAHKPPTNCTWAAGETQAHLAAKMVIRDAFRARGYQADFEVEVLSVGGDRRADVLIRHPNGKSVAVEVQHQPILYDAIERRTLAYMAADLPMLWVGILTKEMREKSVSYDDGMKIEKYTIRPWEKWANALAFGELWYIDPFEGTVWKGDFKNHIIDVPSSSWYSTGGEEHSAGGYSRTSKRWKTLYLQGPYQIGSINIAIKYRGAWASKAFNLPKGQIAIFQAP